MEPRLGSRGKSAIVDDERIKHEGFNGAATWKSRKVQRFSITGSGITCFNGAATWKSRKVDFVAFIRHLAPPCFNGAATWKSRKEVRGPEQVSRTFVLQWSRDLEVAESFACAIASSAALTLQWSRDLEVAERLIEHRHFVVF